MSTKSSKPYKKPERQKKAKEFIVNGHVRYPSGKSLVSGIVRAFDKDLRSEECLGETTTDREGQFEITYTAAQFQRAEKGSADLLVRVFSKEGLPLLESSIIFNAPRAQRVDLVLDGVEDKGPSEYERLLADLKPVLQGLEPFELSEKDIPFLNGETGSDSDHMKCLIIASSLSQKTNMSAEAFYGLFRQDLPTDIGQLMSHSPAILTNALDASARENIISASTGERSESIIAGLRDYAVQYLLQQPGLANKASLTDLLGTAIDSPEKKSEFLQAYIQHDGPIEDFWRNLRQSVTLGSQVDAIQFTLQLGALTKNNLPLTERLRQMQAEGKLQSFKDLAKYTTEDWKNLIKGEDGAGLNSMPTDVPGATQTEKLNNYATTMTRMIENAFPTAAIAYRIQKDDLPGKADLTTFFGNNPHFDFGTTLIDSYVSKPDTVGNIVDSEGLKRQLKRIQRVFKLTHYYDEMSVLLHNGLHSALAVTRSDRSSFVQAYGALIGRTDRAESIYENAAQVSATALTLLANFAPAFNRVNMHALNPQSNAADFLQDGQPADIPDLTTLFGSFDLCACEDCKSVLSPAAYLVDILHFLGDRNSKDGSAKDTLDKRRPDLGETNLTCENTNTPLPYIDLVNELLENYTVNALNPPQVWPQTTRSPDELLANPENLNTLAYTMLAKQVFPWNQPFDLWLETVRAYLRQLGVERYDLMRIFQKIGAPSDPTDVVVAAEYLGLSPVESQIITGAAANNPWEFWGYLAAGTWDTDLTDVPIILDKAKLSYQDLTEILATKFVNPTGSITITLSQPDDPQDTPLDACNPEDLIIDKLTQQSIDHIHRFVRLWRKLGWTKPELDIAISILQANTAVDLRMNDTFLLQVSRLQKIHADSGLPVDQLLALWGNIDIDGSNSLYDRLFQNLAVLSPVDSAFTIPQGGSDLPKPDGISYAKISDHTAAILAALGISATDLATLALTEINKDLNLSNLSKLYRITILAKICGISIINLLTLKSMSGINPFDVSHTEDTMRFIDTAKKMQASGLKTEELDYLLRDQFSESSGIAPTEAAIAIVLDDFRKGLQKIATDNSAVANLDDPTGDMTKPKLASLPGFMSDDVNKAMSILNMTWAGTSAEAAAFIDLKFADFVDPVQAKTSLVGSVPPALATPEERFTYILDPLITYIKRINLITQKLAAALTLRTDACGLLLTKWVNSPAPPYRLAISDFLAVAFAESDLTIKLTASGFLKQFNTFTLLFKISRIINRYKLTPTQLSWLFEYGPTAGWIDLNRLPVAPVSSPSTLFDGWQRMLDLLRLRDQLPGGETTLSQIFTLSRATNPIKDVFMAKLSELTGWNSDDLQYLDGAKGLNFTFPNAYQDEQALSQLRQCFTTMKRLGASAQCRDWTQPNLQSTDAQSVIQLVKAKHGDDEWSQIAKPLRDALRVKQRDSLVAYMFGHPNPDPTKKPLWKDEKELYDYFLIDVNMDACMLTSRIKQAISSVQLFVQRCLMNLEPSVQAVGSEWRWWKWMKSYRVWEANRKVFLWPENWVRPELLDHKSPFFKDLENELLQKDVTQDTAETAYEHYLEKLDGVSNLEICGIYHETETSGLDVFHVIARTRGIPHVYYYRQRVDSSYWTAWEKVDVDIEGDYILPIVWNRRLHIFWAVFTQEPESQALQTPVSVPMPDANNPIKEPDKYWRIKLAWSERQKDKWATKKLLPFSLVPRVKIPIKGDYSVGSEGQDYYEEFAFKIYLNFDDCDLVVNCYHRCFAYSGNDADSQKPIFDVSQSELGKFCLSGCQKESHVVPFTNTEIWLVSPTNSDVPDQASTVEKQTFAEPETSADNVLYLTSGDAAWNESFKDAGNNITNTPVLTVPTLKTTQNPLRFRIIYPHQDPQFTSQRPFFYMDDQKTFFIIPEEVQTSVSNWSHSEQISLEIMNKLQTYYFAPQDSSGNAEVGVNITNPSFPISLPLNNLAKSGFVMLDAPPHPTGQKSDAGQGMVSAGRTSLAIGARKRPSSIGTNRHRTGRR